MKTFKKILKIFVILIILLIGIIIAIPFLFKDKLVEIAKEEINKMVNAKIEFGEFDLSIFKSFPDLNFQINDVMAVGINEFENDTLISLGKLTADVNLMSILGDNIKVNAVILDKPVIHAKVLKGVQANWDIAPPSADTTEAVEDTAAAEPMNLKLNLDKFRINNADVVYDDQDMSMFAEIKNLNFALEGDMTLDFTSLSSKTSIDEITFVMEGVKYLNKTNIEIVADLDADLAGSKFTFKENSVRLNFLELGFDGWIALPDENIDMDLSFEAGKTDFRNILSLVPAVYLTDFESVKTEGKLALNGYAKGTYSENYLPAFSMDLLIENAMFKYPDLPGSATNIQVDLNVKNDDGIDDHTVINLKRFHVDFADNPIDARLLVQTPVSDPQLDAEVKGRIDLDNMKTIVPLEDQTLNGVITMDVKMKGMLSMLDNEQYEAFEALGQIAVDNMNYSSEDLPQGVKITHTDMTVSPQFFSLNTFDASIGNSDVHLEGRIDNFLAYAFRDELLKGSFNFTSRLFDANQFLTDDGSDTEDPGASAEVAETGEEMSVFEVPKNIDFELNTNIGKLKYENIDIENVSGGVVMCDGRIGMKNLGMNLLEGALLMNGSYDTKDISKPVVDFDLKMTDFDIPKTYQTFNTVQKLAPVAENCSGKFSMAIKLNSLLQQNMEPDLNSVVAEGRLQTKNIVIKKSNTLNKIGEELKMDKFKTLSLQDIDLLFKVQDGKVTVEPFSTKIGSTIATIGGNMGLDQSLDYTMNLTIPRKEFGSQANTVLNNLVSQAGQQGVDVKLGDNVDVDVLIGGTVSDPKIRISLKNQAKNIVEDIKDQVIEKVKEEFDKAKQEAIAKAKAQAAKLLSEADAKGKMLIKEAESKSKQVKDAAKKAADVAKNEAYTQAKGIEDAAKGKPKILRDAAKKSADEIRKKADSEHANAVNKANREADGIVNEAKKKSDNLKKTAQQEGDRLIKKAENS
ncbi:MAG: AsmA family protein [Bacteroidetes bacterium]|nr:AsmA family protein [Bacteroidota bacterium]